MNTEQASAPPRYNFDKRTIQASDREWLAYRLTGYNEKVQLLLSQMEGGNKTFEQIQRHYLN